MKKLPILLACMVAGQGALAGVIWSEDFEGDSAGDAPANSAFTNTSGLRVRGDETASPFGSGNLWMEAASQANGNWTWSQLDSSALSVATLSFDAYFDETAFHTSGNRWRLRAQHPGGASANLVLQDIGYGFQDNAFVPSVNQVVHFDIIYNMTGSPVDYTGGSVAAGSYDVVTNGVVHVDDNPASAIDTITRFTLWQNSTVGSNSASWIDNMVIRDEAYTALDAELVQLGDGFTFGSIFHPTATDETLLQVTYANTGLSEDLTVENIFVSDTAGGVFSLVSAPAFGIVVAPGETFDVEIKATGGDGTTLGAITIDVSHGGNPENDQDRVDPISADITTVADPPTFSYEPHVGFPKVTPGSSKPSFTVISTGLGGTLDITSAAAHPLLSVASPALPVSIPAGTSMVFEVEVDASATPGLLTDTLTLVTSDPLSSTQGVDVAFNVFASTSVVLVDYDDGIANGMHDMAVRNGGFEQGMDGDSFEDTPDWASKTTNNAEPQSAEQLTFATDPATGSLRGRTGSWRNPGQLFIPVHDLLPEEWTLEAGDYFTVEFRWKAGDGFDPNVLTFNCVMFGQNADGTVINPIPDRPIQVESTTTQITEYNTVSFDSNPLAPDASALGLGFRFLLEANDSNNLPVPGPVYALIDDVSLIGHFDVGAVTEPVITSVEFAPATMDVTLQWTDEGRVYKVQAGDGHDWSAATDIPLDGSETITNGTIEYRFTDPGAVGAERYWRIAD